MVGIFIFVGTHYFQSLTSTLRFVAHVCGGLWLVPATDRAFCGCVLCSAVSTLAIVSNRTWQRLSWVGNFAECGCAAPIGSKHTSDFVQLHVAAMSRHYLWFYKVAIVLWPATLRSHLWFNKEASVIEPLRRPQRIAVPFPNKRRHDTQPWMALSRSRRRSIRVMASIDTHGYLRRWRRAVNGRRREVDTCEICLKYEKYILIMYYFRWSGIFFKFKICFFLLKFKKHFHNPSYTDLVFTIRISTQLYIFYEIKCWISHKDLWMVIQYRSF